MVSKLVFKGDKDKKKKKKRSRDDEFKDSRSKRHKEGAVEDEINIVNLNNKEIRLDELDPDVFSVGWTTATCIQDLTGPIMICKDFIDDKDVGALAVNQLGEPYMSHDLTIIEESQTVNFTPDPQVHVDLSKPVQKIEPKSTNQVFVILDVENLIDETHKAKGKERMEKSLVLKADSKYLSYDSTDAKLYLTEVITKNEIFTFRLVKTKTGYKWFIYVNNERIKLSVTPPPDFKIKLPRNSDDEHTIQYLDETSNELDQAGLFVVRIQTQNSSVAKRCLREMNKSTIEEEATNSLLNANIKSLMDDGIQVTNGIMKRLMRAIEQGAVNEEVIDIKQKHKSDSRC